MSDDQSQFILLLNQAIQADPGVRNQAIHSLDKAFEQIEAFNLLFQVIEASYYGNSTLLASIFLQNWVKKHYKCLENQEIQDLLRVRSLNAYKNEPLAPAKSQITLAIVTMGTLDFPLNTYLLENVPRDSDVSYQLLKNIVKMKYCIYREKLEFIFKNINVKLDDFFQNLKLCVQNQQDIEYALKALKMPLKLRVLESRVLTDYQTSVLEYLKQLEFLHILKKEIRNQNLMEVLLQIIYYYHKCILRAMSRQEKVDTTECSYVLSYLKTYYFDDRALMATRQIASLKDLNKIVQSSDEERNFQEKILRITLQVVRMVNTVLDSYSYQPAYECQEDYDQFDLEGLQMQGKKVLEISFYEGYFETFLQYLFNHAMQLSLIQVYYIYNEPEKSFTEEVEESVAYDIRETSIEFLRTAFIDMKQDYIVELIERQIKIFQEQPLITQIATQQLPFTSVDPGQMWACVLQREAFYSTISRLYRLIRNDIDFEQWFIYHLSAELMDSNTLFLPLKLQILSMIYQYFDSQTEITKEFCNTIAYSCVSLLKSCDIISIKLGCVRCLTQIVEQMSVELKHELVLQRDTIKNIFPFCQQGSSKVLVLEFFVQMLQLNAFDSVWVIKIILNEWQLCKSSMTQSKNDMTLRYDDQNTLSLQGKILQVLCKALRVTPWNVWLPTLEIILNLVHDALGCEVGLNEIFLVENGLSLFLHLLCRLSLKTNEEALSILKSQEQGLKVVLDQITSMVGQIMVKNMGLWNHCVLALGYLIVLGIGNYAIIGEILLQATIEQFDEIKEEAFSRLLFITELFILTNSPEIVIVERILAFLVDKMKIYHPIFQEHSVQQRELISVTHLISVLAYTNNQLFWGIVGKEWFSPMIQKTFSAHKLQIPLVQHKLCLFYLMCSQLIRNDAYVMSQLNVSTHDGIHLNDMTLESFDFLQQYFIKRLDYIPSPIYVAFREIISQSEDEQSIRGLQPPDVIGMQGYIFTYQIIKLDFLSIKKLFQPSETLQRIDALLEM